MVDADRPPFPIRQGSSYSPLIAELPTNPPDRRRVGSLQHSLEKQKAFYESPFFEPNPKDGKQALRSVREIQPSEADVIIKKLQQYKPTTDVNPDQLALEEARLLLRLARSARPEEYYAQHGAFVAKAIATSIIRALDTDPTLLPSLAHNVLTIYENAKVLAPVLAQQEQQRPQAQIDIKPETFNDFVDSHLQGILAETITYLHMRDKYKGAGLDVHFTTPYMDVFYKADLMLVDQKSGKVVGIVQSKSTVSDKPNAYDIASIKVTGSGPNGIKEGDIEYVQFSHGRSQSDRFASFYALPMQISPSIYGDPFDFTIDNVFGTTFVARFNDNDKLLNEPSVQAHSTNTHQQPPSPLHTEGSKHLIELLRYCQKSPAHRGFLNINSEKDRLFLLLTDTDLTAEFTKHGVYKTGNAYSGNRKYLPGMLNDLANWRRMVTQSQN